MYKPNNKKMLTVLIAVAMIFSAFAVLSLATQPAAAVTPTQSFTLTPNSALASVDSRLYVTSSSVTFPSGATIYAEWSTTGTWTTTSTIWASLVAGQTSIVGLFAPTFNEASGTYYLLVSSSSSGTTGTYASEAISVVSTAPSVSTLQSTGFVGSTVNVTGLNFPDNTPVNIYFLQNPTTATNFTAAPLVTTATANATGVLTASFTVPNTPYGSYGVIAVDTNGTTTVYGYQSSHWYASYSVGAAITVSYSSGNSIYAGQSFSVSGTGFHAGATVTITDNDIANSTHSKLATTPSTLTVASDGSFSAVVSTAGDQFTISGAVTASTLTAKDSSTNSASATATVNITAASVTVSPGKISPGGSLTVTGINFYPGGTIAANSIEITSGSAILTNSAVTVSSTGTFSVSASTLTLSSGTLTSGTNETVTATENLPAGLTSVNGNTHYSATGLVNISSPSITVTFSSGYSLNASANMTISGTNFFPGATIGANLITFDGLKGTNSAIVVPSSGSFSVQFTAPTKTQLSSVSAGVYELTVPESAPSGVLISPASASDYVIYSNPTISAMSIVVGDSASSAPAATLASQNVGNTVYYYLFGYPAAQTVTLYMGGDIVAASIMTDLHGAYYGTFTIPAMPGSTSGTSYSVQTQSTHGLAAENPATVDVVPEFSISATESYFTSYGYLAAGDYFNISGTGFAALSAVTLKPTSSDSNLVVMFVASSVTTDVNGSFTAEAQVTDSSSSVPLQTNDPVDLTVSTTGASYDYYTANSVYPFYELGTPSLTLKDTTTSTNIGTTGDSVSVTASNLISNTKTGVSYTVSGSLGATLTGLIDTAATGTIKVTSSSNGTVTETLAANVSGLPKATEVFLVSVPGSTGYLLNSTRGNFIKSSSSGSFTIYAIGFAKGSSVSLGSTGALKLSLSVTETAAAAADGAAIFSVKTTSAIAGTYLLYGIQTSPAYETGFSSSIVVSIGANLTLSHYTGTIGATITPTAYGLVPDNYYNLYFGTMLLTSSPFLGKATLSSFDVPAVAPGLYNVTVVKVGSTIPVASATFNVTSTVEFSLSTDAPVAFPGQLVTFSWPVAVSAGLNTPGTTYGPVEVTVLLNGTAFTTLPAAVTINTNYAYLNGSFQMPNDPAGSYWTVTLSYYQVDYAASSSSVKAASTTSGSYIQLVSGGGALVVGVANLTATIDTAISSGMKVPLSELNASVVAINNASATIKTEFGTMTASLKAINATVASIEAGQVLVQTDLGMILTNLSSLGANLVAFNNNVALINTTLGMQSASLKAINATVHSNANSLSGLVGSTVYINSTLGSIKGTVTSNSNGIATIHTQIGDLNTTTSAISTNLGKVTSQSNSNEIFLIVIIVLVLITLVMAFMAVNAANKASRKVSEEKKQ